MLCEKYDLEGLAMLMSQTERKIVFGVDAHEREFGKELPDNSFYKCLALRICAWVVSREIVYA